ncbi:MAG: putative peptidoglycan-binding protein [candidate division NC10 bacterium]|nr:putative peptidoglycan-binding protein [candidate division NC10 bacterium]
MAARDTGSVATRAPVLSCAAVGSVRKATWRQYWSFLGLNVVVSAATTLLILSVWGRPRPAPAATVLPTLAVAERLASVIPTASSTLAPTATPVTYVVQSGDTLMTIAQSLGVSDDVLMKLNKLNNPDDLDVGQILLVPTPKSGRAPTETPEPRPTAQPTVTPLSDSQAPRVEIRGVDGVGDLESEAIRLLNTGGVAKMAGWTLDDGRNQVYVFPSFTLHNGAVSVNTRPGTDTVIDLFWGLSEPVLASGKIVTLRDADGNVQSTFSIP